MFRQVPRISCSLLAAYGQGSHLSEVVRDLDSLAVDMIHYDVSDQARSLDLQDLEYLRDLTPLPFDVHLSVPVPGRHVEDLKLDAGDYFCLHAENEWNVDALAALKSRLGCNFGLALNTSSEIDLLFDKAPLLDYVLFMASTPGVSGGDFDESVVDKIKRFRQQYPMVRVHVDGGVNNYSAALLRDIGVDVLISGSYILKAEDGIRQVMKLFGRNLYLRVADIMRPREACPVVGLDAGVREIAREVQNKRVGCTCVVDERGMLEGLITDGDLRRCLIDAGDLSSVAARDLMTRRPFTVRPHERLLDLLREIECDHQGVAVVPVAGRDGSYRGLVYLQDLLFSDML